MRERAGHSSFQRLLAAATLAETSAGWKYNGKLEGRRMAEELGVRCPALLAGPAPLERIALPDAPCVLKPIRGCGGRAVFPLVPAEGGRWRNLFESRLMTWDSIVQSARAEIQIADARAAAMGKTRPIWAQEESILGGPERLFIAEALVAGPVNGLPYNWRCHAIGGEVMLVRQRFADGPRGMRNSRARYWNRDGSPAVEIATPPAGEKRIDPAMPCATFFADLVAAAELIAKHVGALYLGVDMYEDGDGPLFGEVTPFATGGSIRLPEVWDRRLGDAWVAAGAGA